MALLRRRCKVMVTMALQGNNDDERTMVVRWDHNDSSNEVSDKNIEK